MVGDQNSPLCTVPLEVLERIALELVDLRPLGPLGPDFINLLCTCDHIYQALDIGNYSFYARIFCHKFDVTSGKRRGYHNFNSEDLTMQLIDYSCTLRDIRRYLWNGDYENVTQTFWIALLMLLENDGKNIEQLMWAGLDILVNRYVRTSLWANQRHLGGWPDEDEEKALALWLMWLLTTPESLAQESEAERQEIVTLVLPYVIVNYRYASAQAPANHFHLPIHMPNNEQLTGFPFSVQTAHGPYPCYRDISPVVLANQFYRLDLKITVPTVSTPAKLLYFSRRQIHPFGIPAHLSPTRADALARGHMNIGPTQEDIMELNQYKSCPLPPKGKANWWRELSEEQWGAEVGALSISSKTVVSASAGFYPSASSIKGPLMFSPTPLKALSTRWDHDWNRWTHCFDPRSEDWTPLCYTPGSMNGLWQGRMLIPDEGSYQRLITMPHMPPNFSENYFRLTTVPMYMRLEEFQCKVVGGSIPCGGARDGFDDGAANAWFPRGMMSFDTVDGVRIDVEGRTYYYDKLVQKRPMSSPQKHDAAACPRCLHDRVDDESRRRKEASKAAEPFEHEFTSVGLGRHHEHYEGTMDSDVDEIEREYYGQNRCDTVEDIILIGATDLRHGQAWNHFIFYGRVRRWDGLIGILRLSRDQHLGNIFLYGYLVGGQNFVGNWRMANTDMGVPAWECAFTMSKRDEGQPATSSSAAAQ